jgi:hypothetical protein
MLWARLAQCRSAARGANGSEHSILHPQQSTPSEGFDLMMVAWLQLDTYLLMRRERITMADAGSVVWLQPLGSVERRRPGSGEVQSKDKRNEKTDSTQGTPASRQHLRLSSVEEGCGCCGLLRVGRWRVKEEGESARHLKRSIPGDAMPT